MEMTRDRIDLYKRLIILLVIALSLFGVLMIYSSSYILAREHFGDSNFFLKRQLLYLMAGAGVFFVTSHLRFEFLLKYALFINIALVGILVLTLVPGLGIAVKGASRWVGFGGIRIQPGEFLKFSLILLAPVFFENYEHLDLKSKIGYVAALCIPLLILTRQPDFGTFSICTIGIFFTAFLSKFSRKKFYFTLLSSTVLSVFILILEPYRIKRLISFLDPWKSARSAGFQVIQSFLAFANGSLLGQGLGNGNQKLFYLPEAHNDFIFSVVGEELGLVGVIAVVLAFTAFIYCGFKLALCFRGRLSFLISSGIIFMLGIQAAMNMGVVLGLLPTKGLNLPFLSFGGSSLISNMWALGIFMSAHRASFERNAPSGVRL
ncbi:MAG: cell division protein FtsW [Bdellovibrionales bacterium GWA2_49_15]|nr:MAG: cell division protein FtsW [Bdellovibrionales bacterium GWA2_49_15]